MPTWPPLYTQLTPSHPPLELPPFATPLSLGFRYAGLARKWTVKQQLNSTKLNSNMGYGHGTGSEYMGYVDRGRYFGFREGKSFIDSAKSGATAHPSLLQRKLI